MCVTRKVKTFEWGGIFNECLKVLRWVSHSTVFLHTETHTQIFFFFFLFCVSPPSSKNIKMGKRNEKSKRYCKRGVFWVGWLKVSKRGGSQLLVGRTRKKRRKKSEKDLLSWSPPPHVLFEKRKMLFYSRTFFFFGSQIPSVLSLPPLKYFRGGCTTCREKEPRASSH